ncbi:MAG: sulfatase-like hydrolase/transferase [Candidatus Eremiobacterota bacterium]
MGLSLPFLFSAFTLLHFYFTNFVELRWQDAMSTLGLVMLVVLALVGAAWAALRDPHKAGLLALVGAFCFFSHERIVYGYCRFFLDGDTSIRIRGFLEPPHALQVRVFWILAAISVVAGLLLQQVRRDLGGLTRFCFRFSAAVVVVTAVSGFMTLANLPRPVLPLPQAHRSDSRPDIYLIILDGFGRADVLEKRYGFSIEPFLNFLGTQGFRVFSQSRANYPTTAYSLSSELNFTYLDKESIGVGEEYANPYAYPLTTLMAHNRLTRFLKSQGYQIVNIYGGGDFTRRFATTDLSLGMSQSVNGFSYGFAKHTPLALFASRWLRVPELDRRREAILQGLDQLRRLPAETSGPRFVMVHLLCPHEPFFLRVDGGRPHADPAFDWQGRRQYPLGYAGQAQFLAAQMQAILPALVRESAEPPVILLHGDHGPAPLSSQQLEQALERYPNLCAMRLPGADIRVLPEDVTPVNYFRWVLNFYFDTRLEILPNKSYRPSDAQHPFLFEDITPYFER